MARPKIPEGLEVPKATAVNVVATQPTTPDRAMIAQLRAEREQTLPDAAFLVLVSLQEIPPATAMGWALYVGTLRIPKYWEYKDGIYFKVFDPQFFADHKGERLRFSADDRQFIDTGLNLTAPAATARATATRTLPKQEDVLNAEAPRRPRARKRPATRARRPRAKQTRARKSSK